MRVADFIAVERGRKNARPQLLAAITLAQRANSELLVAKLDRLARGVAFLSTLLESRVRFRAVDLLAPAEFTLHILAVAAQKEASALASRIRAALAAKNAVVKGKSLHRAASTGDKRTAAGQRVAGGAGGPLNKAHSAF